MNKTELTELLSKKTGMSKADSKRAVDALFSTAPREGIIATAVSKGDKVQITGFGTFREPQAQEAHRTQPPRPANPSPFPAASTPAFVAGKSLKERVRK